MLGRMLEQLLYRGKGLVMDDITYRHSSGAVPTLVTISAKEQLNSTAYAVMNNILFANPVNYTVGTGYELNVMRVDIDVVAVGTDGDCLVALYADSTAVMEFNIPQNIGHYEMEYPICRPITAAEVLSIYGKALAENVDRTFNVIVKGLLMAA